MKTVFTNPQSVAHLWANQQQAHARNRGNFYFEGLTIYSYGSHFPIATLVPEKNSVLFTTRGYSNSTAKHINMASSASSQYERINCKHPLQASEGEHLENLQAFEAEAKQSAMKLKRAKKPSIYLSEIANQRNQYTKYCEFFGLKKVKGFVPEHLLIESADGGRVATEKEHARIEKQKRADERARKRQAEAVALKLAEDVAKFRAFELDGVYRRGAWTPAPEFSYLRFNKGTKRVETSQKVEIPEAIARRAYKWIKTTVKAGGCTGDCEYKILEFSVKYVSANEFRVGCHLIQMSEADALAKQLGW